jgi:nucleosome assembly protein 1-like 1
MDPHFSVVSVQAIEMDFALGAAIADDIVPSALKYYTGQAQMEEDMGDEDFDHDDDEDDDDDDDDDDDNDDDDDDEDHTGPPKAGPAGGECKQQ